MKTISANQRILNILQNAVNNGFTFEEQDPLEEIRIKAEDFLIENTEAIEAECDITQTTRQQFLHWQDDKGYVYEQWGEIVDFSDHWHKEPDTHIDLACVLDSEGQVVQLYYRVGETEYNVPSGYVFKNGKHIEDERN